MLLKVLLIITVTSLVSSKVISVQYGTWERDQKNRTKKESDQKKRPKGKRTKIFLTKRERDQNFSSGIFPINTQYSDMIRYKYRLWSVLLKLYNFLFNLITYLVVFNFWSPDFLVAFPFGRTGFWSVSLFGRFPFWSVYPVPFSRQ